MPPYTRHPTSYFKLLAAVIVIVFYLLYAASHHSKSRSLSSANASLPKIQLWPFETGAADEEKRQQVVKAMKRTFSLYKSRAWGFDDIKPLTGVGGNSRNGWGAFIVDTSTTLALMGLWDELELELDYITGTLNFSSAMGPVDYFETTIRYLGALVSLTDLIDAGVVPSSVAPAPKRDAVLSQAVTLAQKLAPAFDTPSGIPWPLVDFETNTGQTWQDDDPDRHPSVGLARAGSNILENRVLSRLTGNKTYILNATLAWGPLVWGKYVSEVPGLVDSPRDILTGAPAGRQSSWDSGHDSYYEYLLKAAMLAPSDRYSHMYQRHWLRAAGALRRNLSSRSAPSQEHVMQHLFMGSYDGHKYLNKMSHLACFAPGNLMLGGRLLGRADLIDLGKALLEACRHSYSSSATNIGPEVLSWVPNIGQNQTGVFEPESEEQRKQLDQNGFWAMDPKYRLRPEYVESLFYGWRITGEQRYRDWAWEAFQAIERTCRAEYGYAAIADVTKPPEQIELLDESESFWGAETLKYLYLIFADVDTCDLDLWILTTEGHPLRRIVAAY